MAARPASDGRGDGPINAVCGPTATLLTFLLEYVKLCAPRPLRKPAYAAAGWLLWPFRYLDIWLNRRPDAHVLANSIYALVRKPR